MTDDELLQAICIHLGELRREQGLIVSWILIGIGLLNGLVAMLLVGLFWA